MIIYTSTVVRSRTLLVSGSVAIIGYIGYFTAKHSLNSIGWPLSLIFCGLMLFLVSAGTVRLHRRIRNE